MPTEGFELLLDHEGMEWLRTRFITDRGKVVWFSAQYETMDAGERLPVVRYDSAHGTPHRDLLRRDGTAEKTWFEEMSLGEALTMGIQDIRANWRSYRRQYWGEEA